MKIRIEMPQTVTKDQVALLLEQRKLRVPVFFDPSKNDEIIIMINNRSRLAAFELITWLLTL